MALPSLHEIAAAAVLSRGTAVLVVALTRTAAVDTSRPKNKEQPTTVIEVLKRTAVLCTLCTNLLDMGPTDWNMYLFSSVSWLGVGESGRGLSKLWFRLLDKTTSSSSSSSRSAKELEGARKQ